MKRCLIVGVDSTIGSGLFNALQSSHQFDVYGTTRHQRRVATNDRLMYLDLADVSDFSVDRHFDYIFLCAAMTDMNWCEIHREQAYKINVDAQIGLAHRFIKNGIKKIFFFSSEAVFDGSVAFPSESEQTRPFNYYGYLKEQAENQLLKFGDCISILRITKVVAPFQGVLQSWTQDLCHGKIIYPFEDLYLSPITMDYILFCLLRFIEADLSGIVHISNGGCFSYYAFADALCCFLGVSRELLAPISFRDRLTLLYTPLGHAGLSMKRMRSELSIEPWSLNEVFASLTLDLPLVEK